MFGRECPRLVVERGMRPRCWPIIRRGREREKESRSTVRRAGGR